ncbi:MULTISPECIES: 2-dehydropantoate 2-reductase [Bacillus]|uniref:2-dehydropantoate 2-reductase n=1 Tax=Bacillus TaxID=1386 RepID=UPI000BB8B8B4|nr:MULTISPECIES: 2-dehydropantoate 2-reductase [Bacillus]
MRVGIIGAGAVGMLFAHYLSTTFKVSLYVRRHEQALLLKNGLCILQQDEFVHINKSIEIKVFGECPLEENVQVVTVKQYSLEPIIEIFQNSKNVDTVIFLQNGMGHIEQLQKLEKEIWLGVVEHGVRKESDNTITLTGMGETKLAPFNHQNYSNPFIHEWERNRNDAFKVTIKDNWNEVLTTKLIVNAVINPLTALFQVKNGELLNNKNYKKTMRLLFEEVYSIVPVSNKQKLWEHIVQICLKTKENYSSMYRDVEKRQKTEIDAILGYILRRSQEQKQNAPLTQFLFECIKGKTE